MYTRTQKLIYSEQGAKLRKTGTEEMLYFKGASTIPGQPIIAMWWNDVPELPDLPIFEEKLDTQPTLAKLQYLMLATGLKQRPSWAKITHTQAWSPLLTDSMSPLV